MRISTDGLVIREQNIREQDKAVTLLTRSKGIVHAFVHGAKSIKSSKSTATGLLTYSRFTIFINRDRYIIDEAYAQEVFFDLRKDVEKLALAQYFCEMLSKLAPENEDAQEYLRLVLNSLHYLCKGNRPNLLIKSAFELRLLSLAGYMPNLVCCNVCACYEHENMFFLPQRGILVCGNCINRFKECSIQTGIGVTAAMRHCIYSEFSKLFAFTLPDTALEKLELASEEYVRYRLERSFTTLEFYKQIRS